MTTYKLRDGVLRAELDGEEVLLNPETGVYHLVNGTGIQVLIHFEAAASVDEVVRLISEATHENASHVRQDVIRFVDAMVERNLLERVEDEGAKDSGIDTR